MNDRELARFVYENSSEPIIKNPVLRKALQPRLGFYLGKSVPSKGTIEDADTKKAEDALSGVNEVMKVADLQRQGHIGHFYADGGRIGFADGKNAGVGYEKRIKVKNYLTNLPDNSSISVLDLADDLKVSRSLIDNILKEKEFKKKKFNLLRKTDSLTNEQFATEYKNFQKSDFF